MRSEGLLVNSGSQRPNSGTKKMLGLVGGISFLVTMLCCENADRIGRAMRVVDSPDGCRKRHVRPTPLVGGTTVFLALSVCELGMLASTTSHDRFYVALIVATTGFWLIGYLDDRLNLNPVLRLIASTVFFGIVLSIEPRMIIWKIDLGAHFQIIDLGPLAVPFTLLCLVGLVHAINMADGRNGVVLGLAICWAYGLGEYAQLKIQPFFSSIVVIFIVVLLYNWKDKLFLGNSGSYLIGALLGLLTIYSYNDPKSSIPAAAAAIWLVVPVLDCLRLVVLRSAIGRAPWHADENHLHNYLSSALEWPIALLVYLTVAAAPGFGALLWPDQSMICLGLALLLYAITVLWATRGRNALGGIVSGGGTFSKLISVPASARANVFPVALDFAPTKKGRPDVRLPPVIRDSNSVADNVARRPSIVEFKSLLKPNSTSAEGTRLLFVVNDASFFVSHRLPIALAMRDLGAQVSVAALPDCSVSQIEAQGLTFHSLAVDRTGTVPWHDAITLLQLSKIVRKVRPTLMHCVTIKPMIYGGILARAFRVPGYIGSVTGLGQMMGGDGFKMRAARWVALPAFRFALGHSNASIIFQNEDDLSAYGDFGLASHDKSVLIRGSGVDPDKYHVSEEPSGPPIVLFPARLLWAKGVGVFVATARCLRRAGFDARFVIAGEPPVHNRDSVPTEELRRWEAAGIVEWWGYRDDMPSVLASSSIVCLPTYYREGVPRALIEAAASGKAIVTTEMPGCKDICQHEVNGLLVPPQDPASLVAALATLLVDPERRRKMGTAGREIFISEFSIENVVSRTLAVYGRLISAHPSDIAAEQCSEPV